MATALYEAALQRYHAKPGRGVSPRVAQAVGPELATLQMLSAGEVVEHVRHQPHMAIHQQLTWDNDKIGDQFRAREVTNLRGAIVEVVVLANGETREARSFYAVPARLLDPDDERRDRRHQSLKLGIALARVRQEPALAAYVVEAARTEFLHLLLRYRSLEELLTTESPGGFGVVFAGLEVLAAEARAAQAAKARPRSRRVRRQPAPAARTAPLALAG
jgi:hypothetical protein